MTDLDEMSADEARSMEVVTLRVAFEEIMVQLWEGGVDGGDVQDILERHGLLIGVPADYITLNEYECSTMFTLRWNAVNEHDMIGMDAAPDSCRWCGLMQLDDPEPCVDRLADDQYAQIFAEGGIWNHETAEWITANLDVGPLN